MNRRLLPLLPALLVSLPLAAQSFGDSPAFGGSSVFSNGLNPLGNSARFDRVPSGWYAGWQGGDEKARGFRSDSDALAQALAAGDTAAAAGLAQALDAEPEPLRISDYGLEYAGPGGVRFSLGRELHTGVRMLSGSGVEARRVRIDRMITGAGSNGGSSAYGVTFRVERVHLGQADFPGSVPDPALAFSDTQRDAWTATADAGYLTTLTQGLRFGLTASRLIPRHFLDVYEQPQARAGFELDLGTTAQLSLEGDLNSAARLPLPEKQKTVSASLRLLATPTITLQVGAERRTTEGSQAATLVGATLRIVTAPLMVAVGFQFGDDRPQRAFALRIGG